MTALNMNSKPISQNMVEDDDRYGASFTGAYIKYLRLQNGYNQEYVSHGICSVSHLSYFENGKKRLHSDQISMILKKFGISEMKVPDDIVQIHTIMQNMLTHIEDYDDESARVEFDRLKAYEDVLKLSPYFFEYKVYSMIYLYFVMGRQIKDQADDLKMLDGIYTSFPENLRYWYLFISGVLYARCSGELRLEGIRRLGDAASIRRTTWLYFCTGVVLSYSDKGQAIFDFEKALDNYETGGRYQNAIWCRSYLGCCYSELGMYDMAEKYLSAAFNSLQYISTEALLNFVYNNYANMYMRMGDYQKCHLWSARAMAHGKFRVIAAYNYIYSCIMLGEKEERNKTIEKYTTGKYRNDKHYLAIRFEYLWVNCFDDRQFYDEVKSTIIPYYEKMGKKDMLDDIYSVMIDYLENHRLYKEATLYYRKLLEVRR